MFTEGAGLVNQRFHQRAANPCPDDPDGHRPNVLPYGGNHQRRHQSPKEAYPVITPFSSLTRTG
jgi:hypothetical protein